VLVHRIAGGLHHKHIYATHVFEQLEVNFAVGKALDLDFAYRNANITADFLSQGPVGCAGEELEALVLAQITVRLRSGAGLSTLALRHPVPVSRPDLRLE